MNDNKYDNYEVYLCGNKECDLFIYLNEPNGRCFSCGDDAMAIGLTLKQYREMNSHADSKEVFVPTPLPFEVIPLTDIPRAQRIGLTVFHPTSMDSSGCNWNSYDIGVIYREYDDPHGNPDRYLFMASTIGYSATSLQYGAFSLFVPKCVADNLKDIG